MNGWSFTPYYGGTVLQNQMHDAQLAEQRRQRLTAVNEQEVADVAANNQRTSGTLNTAALASARRRAGGTTFRRRGSGVSANQLVSGLGTANAKALADKRRQVINQDVDQASANYYNSPASKWNFGVTPFVLNN
jgi:hypothetical protein